MVFIFLVKFLFAVSKYDESHSIEIKEQDQPQLFAFIWQLTEDVQTPFPKKIFLSPDELCEVVSLGKNLFRKSHQLVITINQFK